MQETFFSFLEVMESNLPPEKLLWFLHNRQKQSINYKEVFNSKKNASNVDIYQSKKTSFEKKEELKDMEHEDYDSVWHCYRRIKEQP